ncbi:MAG: chorismate mutase [Candidatus Micrarchaeaceae archaeon]
MKAKGNPKSIKEKEYALELEALREKIDSIDKKIVDMLGKRMDVVREVGALKRSQGAEVTDKGREDKVIEKWESLGKQANIPPGLAGSVVSAIFPYSKTQEVKSASPHNICIVGYGAMAKVLAWAFINAGNHVVITGRNMKKAQQLSTAMKCSSAEIAPAILESEYVVLALPPAAFEDGFVEDISKYLRGKLVMDILSTKLEIFKKVSRIAKLGGFKYVSTHPLFGSSAMPVGQKIVVISERKPPGEAEKRVAELYSEIGIAPLFASLDEHEMAMAIVQVVPHFITLSAARAIEMLSKKYKIGYKRFSTPNFENVQKLIDGVKGNIEVVKEIQNFNAYADEARKIAAIALSEEEKTWAKERNTK